MILRFGFLAAATMMWAAAATGAQSPSTTVLASAVQASAPRLTPNFLHGRWTDTNDCSNTVEFLSNGRFITSDGAEGRWSLVGDKLTFIGNSTIAARLVIVTADEIRLVHPDGSTGGSTRCTGPKAAVKTMPALPSSISEALAASRPVQRQELFGKWTDDGDCSNIITFHSDGRFTIPGGEGRWTLEGDRLTFKGDSEVKAVARIVGQDRILLIHPDDTIGQSIRC